GTGPPGRRAMPARRPALPPRPRILVVALRRLGDVLLATPLMRSIRRAWPDARLDALVFADTAGILEGNPDIDRVVAMPARPTLAQSLALAGRLLKRYHLAVSTQSGDRPTLFALAAGRTHAGPVWPGERTKRRLLGRSVVAAGESVHRIEEMLRLGDALGIARVAEVVCPVGTVPAEHAPVEPYAVIHAAPMFRYKQWTRAGWRALAHAPRARGLAGVATGRAGGPRRSAPTWGALRRMCAGWMPACAGRRSPRCSRVRASMWGLTPRSRTWPPRADARRSRCSGRPTRACGGHGRRTACRRPGLRPAPSSTVAMSGWCRTRCRACHASGRAVTAVSTAARNASMSSRRRKCWQRWSRRWR